MSSFDIASTSGNSHLALNVNSNELGIQPHTYFNLYLGHAYTSSSRTFHNDDRTMLIDSLKHVQLFGDLSTTADEPSITLKNTGTDGNDETNLNFADKHGQIHTQIGLQLKDDSNGGTYDSAFHIRTAVNGALATRIAIKDDGFIGIGTTNPLYPFHVAKENAGFSGVFENLNGSGRGVYIKITGNDSATLPALQVSTWDIGGAYTDKFLVKRDGTTYIKENLGIGVTSPDNALTINKAISNNFVVELKQTHNTAGQAWGVQICGGTNSSDAALVVENEAENASLLYVRGDGNIGIGTASPAEILTLDSSSNTRLLLREGGNDKGTIAAGGGGLYIANKAGDIIFRNSSDADTVRIKNNGRVGIGTTSPNARLEIEDNATGAGVLLKVTADDSSPYGIIIGNDTWSTTDTHGLRMWTQDDGTGQIMARGSGDENLILNRDGGNVGIGTTSPVENLHIAQSDSDKSYIQFTNSTTGHTATDGCSIGLGDGEALIIYQREANDIILGTSASTRMTIKSDGKVGINRTAPDTALDVAGVGNNAVITLRQSGGSKMLFMDTSSGVPYLKLYANNGSTEAIKFNTGGDSWFNGGNVGIGDASPSYKLEVAGTFYASGSSQAFKKNVTDLAIDSSAIYNLNPVSYNYKKDYEDFGYVLAEGKQFGLISEEVAKAVPELAIMKDGEPKNVDYQKLSVLLLAEMQKMNKRV